jgi:uncharacterized protein (TIGR02687 family)
VDIEQIKSGLTSLYDKGQRIVFWHDPDGEFAEMVPELDLGDVSVLRLNEIPKLKAKVTIELEQPNSQFLIYETDDHPAPEIDWLLDIRLYAGQFAADRSSMILKELGLLQQSLRNHISARSKFFASKERIGRIARLIDENDDESAIDKKIMATILRVEQPEFFSIVRALFHTIPQADLDTPPSAWDEFDRYSVAESFWSLAEEHFGYAEDKPSLRNLLIRLMISDFDHRVVGGVPKALQHLILPKSRTSNAVVCMGQWRDSASRQESFNALSSAVAEAIKLDNHLSDLDLDALQDGQTFQVVEKHIASRLRNRVVDEADTVSVEAIRDIALRRQDGYWANKALPSTDAAPREALSRVYDALVASAELFYLRNQHDGGFSYPTAKAFYDAYSSELYRFDQLYRHICEAADFAEAEGWDILKSLRDKVEDCYGNWYVTNLAQSWGEHIENGLISKWQVDGIDPQQKFFIRHVQPTLDKGNDRRVFVIISDAFRYEAARELTDQLNGKYRFTADLSTLLGVLPSYTGLGMAALLPHQQLTYSENGTVLADGLSTSGTANRQKILDAVKGVAVKADDFMAMKQAESRDFIKPYRVVYIYHNQIDQTADTGNEEKTFNAVRTTIDEIANLVTQIINNMNGNYIAITADHGFLFQESAPTETDKNAIADKPSGTVISKKRYLLGKNLPNHDKTYHGSTATTATADGDMDFWVPKGTNRFHFVGGSRFIHGGAMLQEIVVPLVKVVQLKGKSAEKTKTKKVGISILGSNLKITTNRYKFNFIQTEAVSDRVKPLTVKVAIYEDGTPITNTESITFDNQSPDMNEWRKEVWLTLAKRPFDKKNKYQLILRDADSADADVTHMDVIIDLAIENDF